MESWLLQPTTDVVDPLDCIWTKQFSLQPFNSPGLSTLACRMWIYGIDGQPYQNE
jgi:hypothetical protein